MIIQVNTLHSLDLPKSFETATKKENGHQTNPGKFSHYSVHLFQSPLTNTPKETNSWSCISK